MPSKPFLLVAAAIAFLSMSATSQAQNPFASCPNCQLKAAAAQSAVVVRPAPVTNFAAPRYVAPAPVQISRPVQYAPTYSSPQVSNYAPAVVARPVYNTPVYRAPVYQAPVQYRPVYRSYAPAIQSGCGGY